jgi:hypothetical protein
MLPAATASELPDSTSGMRAESKSTRLATGRRTGSTWRRSSRVRVSTQPQNTETYESLTCNEKTWVWELARRTRQVRAFDRSSCSARVLERRCGHQVDHPAAELGRVWCRHLADFLLQQSLLQIRCPGYRVRLLGHTGPGISPCPQWRGQPISRWSWDWDRPAGESSSSTTMNAAPRRPARSARGDCRISRDRVASGSDRPRTASRT